MQKTLSRFPQVIEIYDVMRNSGELIDKIDNNNMIKPMSNAL